ncbi:pyridoxamine 5'-phosphate oxidase family protein [Roseovarius rhodophyticola]|uniref:Pyridoxamine 5'-phosphate oxidase family protein n=1 Tax=Roseovarius rhodophyticola TaxID=3080827 RepID=A0ABZ2TDV1_9RHOB|nr:pyridoxamine 5'-phosphate oxidase family protein [Roseovarius sp. W115]MDV2928102.1 pyridoxamine 5'-phosphate oxidase family protein [Roseovarius sp. W115]
MAKAFAELAFTDAVKKIQQEQGSARMYERVLAPETPQDNRLGPNEIQFIAMRDGFYQATVSETGWPYVQFRGGPRGFLKVLDDQTLAYADFRGNRQYISTGNLSGDDRIAMILVDYPNSARVKILGRASLSDDPDLIAQLHDESYKARPERAVVIKVEGFDWNCPQHLPVRLTMEELQPILAPFQQELAALREENARLKAKLGE